jgi:DNA polymerase III epsilon subunit family exonuclease
MVLNISNEDLPTSSVFCVLDIETTGLIPGNAEILEIFILKVIDTEVIDEFYSLFRPKNKIMNSDIHGITNSRVINSPRFNEKNNEILEFIEESVIIGHNIDDFDLEFLNYFLDKPIENKTIDTLKLSRLILTKEVNNHKLKTLADYFGVTSPTHSARNDVIATYEVYKKLISIK